MRINMLKTEEVKEIFANKLKQKDFRFAKNKTGSTTVELQAITVEVDKPYICREPNYGYVARELEWYKSQSLNVNDIPCPNGESIPTIWKAVATENGFINSNYGWCIYSEENGKQYEHCLNTLVSDPQSRRAMMIYTRPSMQEDYKKDGMADFMCTVSVQCFLNPSDAGGYILKYIVNQRSCDAVFGFDNDMLWHQYVRDELAKDLSSKLNCSIDVENIIAIFGSLHVYERHFKFLEN